MKFYLTTPIYYVNDVPHIGHAYTTVAADILARWHRLRSKDVFFLTGTDEHGAKIVQAAAKTGQSPKEFCDRISGVFKDEWHNLAITNDYFVRTTDPGHEKAVQAFLQKLFGSGALYKKNYEGLYCVQCEKFLAPQDLNQDLCCPDHKIKPVRQAEENYFFKLSDYRERLTAILTDGTLEISPLERRNEILGKLKLGLEDISISRASLQWGIPLPFDQKQTAYVWVDALLNYISALGYAENSPQLKKYWPADLHLMAKDILWFHSVIWPALLMAAGLPLPKKVFAHGFFTVNGEKMSKTLGNIIKPKELISRFGIDASRYLLVSLFPFGTDGDISWDALTEKYNADLANNLGNLVSRSLTMVDKFSGGVIPEPGKDAKTDVLGEIVTQLSGAEEALENLEFHRFIGTLQAVIDRANRFIETSAPWKMAKEKNAALPSVLFCLVSHLKAITAYCAPFMPHTSALIWEQLGETEDLEKAVSRYLDSRNIDTLSPRPGTRIRKGGILFPRITPQ